MEHIVIECVTPEVDGGRYPAKRIIGDTVSVGADLIKDGHDLLAARTLYKGPGDADWSTAPMHFDVDSDRWYSEFCVDRLGRWSFTIEAWTDAIATWRRGLEKNVAAELDVGNDLLDGAQLARGAEVASIHTSTPSAHARHATFDDAAAGLRRIASLGFDVVYLAPIHPIGRTHRKGKNNSLTPDPDDVGSPWAIGNEHGGHTAIEPALGGIADFDRFVATSTRSTTR